MHITGNFQETKNVPPLKMIYSADNTKMILPKSVTYRSFFPDNYSKCYYNHYMEQLANTQAFQKGCQKFARSITSLQLQLTSETGNLVRDCEICIQNKRTNNTRITPELIHIPERDLGQEDLKHIDLLPDIPPSGCYENIITTIDVFSRSAFAYPVSNPTAVNTAKVAIDITTRHAYLPTLIITDKRSVFVPQVMHEVAETLGTNLKHATTKQAQTIGILERAHATMKTSLKMATGEFRKQWHKYLPIANLNYNTTNHSSINCKPSRVFHGRVPPNILDHKLGLRFNLNIAATTDFAEELLRRDKISYHKLKKKVMQS